MSAEIPKPQPKPESPKKPVENQAIMGIIGSGKALEDLNKIYPPQTPMIEIIKDKKEQQK